MDRFNDSRSSDVPESEIKPKIQNAMKLDKDLVDKSQSAFVSFLRYYKEHSLQFIFKFDALDIGSVGNSFHLFRLPRVKEIIGRTISNFTTDKSIDLKGIQYVDKNKEK